MVEVIQVQHHNKSLMIGNFRYINIDPRLLILKGFSPFELDEYEKVLIPQRFTLRIGNKKRKFRGFFISEDVYAVQRFLLRYGVMKSMDIHRIISDSYAFSSVNPYLVEWHGKTYAFVKELSSGILTGWNRSDGIIYPVIAGWIEKRRDKNYFYLHRIDAAKNMVHFRFVNDPKNIPPSIILSLSKGFIFNSLRMDEGVDIIPFPPFEIKYALKLYPPSKILRTKNEPLPDEFNEPYIIRTFLPASKGVRVIDASPGIVRTFVQNINVNVYAPSYSNPYWESDYKELWRRSAGYILLCKPESFLESGVG